MASIIIKHLTYLPVYATMVSYPRAQQPPDTIVALCCSKTLLYGITPYFLSQIERETNISARAQAVENHIRQDENRRQSDCIQVRGAGTISERMYYFFLNLKGPSGTFLVPTLTYVSSISICDRMSHKDANRGFFGRNNADSGENKSNDEESGDDDEEIVKLLEAGGGNKKKKRKRNVFGLLLDHGCDHVKSIAISQEIGQIAPCGTSLLKFIQSVAKVGLLEKVSYASWDQTGKSVMTRNYDAVLDALSSCKCLEAFGLRFHFEATILQNTAPDHVAREKIAHFYSSIGNFFDKTYRHLKSISLPMNNAFLKAIAENCPLLEELADYGATSKLSKKLIGDLGDACPSLSTLYMLFSDDPYRQLEFAQAQEDRDWVEDNYKNYANISYIHVIAEHFPSLSFLVTSNLAVMMSLETSNGASSSDVAFGMLFKNCQQLRGLIIGSLDDEENYTDELLNVIGQYGANLEILRFDSPLYFRAEKFRGFSAASWDRLIANCPKLKSIYKPEYFELRGEE